MCYRITFVAIALLTVTSVACPARAAALHTVSIQADGRDELRIGGGTLTVRHFSWQLPTDLVVDGSARPLTWVGSTSAPVAVPINGDYWVRKSAGRDRGWAVQRADGFALTTVDNPNGDDRYAFDFYATPEANSIDWMRVLGGAATPGRMSFAGTGGYVPRPAGEQTSFRVEIDGTDELTFVEGNLVVRHISWQQPTSITINGVSHALTFSNGLSNPIALNLPDRFQFTQTAGRTTLYPVDTPVGLLVGADDELLGPDAYAWTITAIPEPSVAWLIGLGALTLGRVRGGSRHPRLPTRARIARVR
jgi:hypothetical protein